MVKKKILIVEDEIMLLETMKMRLESLDYEVITSENGKDGAFKAISEKPDIIIADFMLPELSGLEMVKIIRSNSDTKNIPVIVVSALGRKEDIEKATAAGANDYIIKPYEVDELFEKIKDLLK